MSGHHEEQFGGKSGYFEIPISTSNLYQPDLDLVHRYSRPIFERPEDHGIVTAQLESRLSSYHQAQHCIALSSGFWALVFALAYQAKSDRSEVVIPSFTYRRLADVVHWAGKTPVFVDVGEDLSMSLDASRSAITSRTSCVLAVHPIVNCCDVYGFLSLSEETGVPVVFDGVESVHETIRGRRVGSFGPPEVFSLHASKLINGLEGGYICLSDGRAADQLRAARDGGLLRNYSHPWPALDARMSDGHAAFALAGLDELDSNISHNKRIYEAYARLLGEIPGVRLLMFDESEQTSFKNIVAEVEDSFPVSRDVLVQFLNSRGVLARAHYDPPLHLKVASYETVRSSLKITERVRARFLNLPCGARVNLPDVRTVCDLIALIGSSASSVGKFL